MREDLALEVVDARYEEAGASAIFQPVGGEAASCLVLLNRAERVADGMGSVIVDATVARVRASEVPEPRRGDAFVIGGQTRRVTGDPRREDPLRLEWTCELGGRG